MRKKTKRVRVVHREDLTLRAPVVYAVIVTRRIGLGSGYSGGDAARRISGLREGVDAPSRLGVLLSCFGEHDSDT